MDQTITMSTLIQMGVVIMGLWGFYKVVKEIVSNITARHDREQRWDEMVQNVQAERDKIYERYDLKLADMEDRIDTNHRDTGEQLKQVKEELKILTDCMGAVLDGLHQQGCNGRVTEASNNLQAYMNMRMHE